MKVFSEVDSGEKLYSVLMGEEEVCVFSGIYLREFARRDYEGLTKENAEKLAAERSRLAKELKEQRMRNKLTFGEMSSDPGNSAKLKISNQNSINQVNSRASEFRENLLKSQESNVPKPNPTEAAKSRLQESTKSVTTNQGSGFMNKAKGFVGRNKVALGIGAGITAAAIGTGLYLQNKNKKNQE